MLTIFLLISIDILFFLLAFILNIWNGKFLNKYIVIFRIIDEIKEQENLVKNLRDNYLITIIVSGLVLILFIVLLIIFPFIPNEDIWRYSEWALDLAKYNPDILLNEDRIEWYLGSAFYTNFYNFYLTSMILGDIKCWELVVKFYVPLLNYVIFILFIIDFSHKINKKYNYISIILLSSSYFLMNWLFYALPTSIAAILGILTIDVLFIKEKRSILLAGICLFFQYLLHSISTLLFLLGILLTYLILFILRNINREARIDLLARIKNKKWAYLTTFLAIIIIIVGGAVLFFTELIFKPSYFARFIDFYSKMQAMMVDYEIRSQPPTLFAWFGELMGPHILVMSVFSIVFLIPHIKNRRNSPNFNKGETQNFTKPDQLHEKMGELFFFYWIFQIGLIIICIFLPVWYLYSTIPYLYYRYFFFIDLSFLFIIPYSFCYLIKIMKKKLNQNNSKFKRYKNIFQFSFLSITITFTSLHIAAGYNLFTHYEYIPESQLKIYYWLRDNTSTNSIYCVPPDNIYTPIYYHPILNDRSVLDPSELINYFDDSLYYHLNSISYHRFLSHIYLGTKLMDLRFAKNTYLERYTTNKTDYFLLDDYNYPNLVNLMNEDNNSFVLLKNETDALPYSNATYNTFLFYFRNNYNYLWNSGFEYDYDEWFLIQEETHGTLYRTTLSPFKGEYSLIFNKTHVGNYGYCKSKRIEDLETQYDYYLSGNLKYIKYTGQDFPARIRFYINYYDANDILISKENVYTIDNYDSPDYTFFNFTFSIISGSVSEEIELQLYSPGNRPIYLFDEINIQKTI